MKPSHEENEQKQASVPLVLPPCRPRMRDSGNSRSGRWTEKEEKFARYIIKCYANGLLRLDHGVTLRTYLSKKLRCLPSRITKKFKGNDDSNIQGAQRLLKDSTGVSPRDVQIAQQNLQALEKEFLQELESGLLSGPRVANYPYGCWQPTPMTTTPMPQQESGEASRDRLLSMSLGLNSILGSLLQRACSENQVMIQQQQTSETMNALMGAISAGQQLLSVPVTPTSCPSSPAVSPSMPNISTLMLSPTSPRLPLSTAPAVALGPNTVAHSYSTVTTGLAKSLSPRGNILPRPTQYAQLRPKNAVGRQAVQATPALKTKSSGTNSVPLEDTPSHQSQDMEDADAFLSFVQSVNKQSADDDSGDNHNLVN